MKITLQQLFAAKAGIPGRNPVEQAKRGGSNSKSE